MKSAEKQLPILLLVLILIASLTACGGKGQETPEQLSEKMYTTEEVNLSLPTDCTISVGCSDGKDCVYFAGVNTIAKTQMSRAAVYKFSANDGTMETAMDSAGMEGDDTNCIVSGLCIGPEGTLWILERQITIQFDLPGDFSIETDSKWQYSEGVVGETVLLRQFDANGNELYRSDFSKQLETDIYKASVDQDGNCYVACNGKLSVFDKSGQELFTIEDENLTSDEAPIHFSDGSMGLLCHVATPGNEAGMYEVREINLEKKGWGQKYELPTAGIKNSYAAYDGGGEYLFGFTLNDCLYGWNRETEEPEKILSWLSTGISCLDIVQCSFLSDGQIAAITQSSAGEDGWYSRFAILSEADSEVMSERTVLTYATSYISEQEQEMITKFNKSQQKYYIEAKDYSVYSSPENLYGDRNMLTTEIIAGKVPDIINPGKFALPMDQYAEKGFFVNLWPYIDNDPELGREQLMSHVLECNEIDGQLYDVFDQFRIQTAIGSRSVVGDRMAWSMEDFQKVLDAIPKDCSIFEQFFTKDYMLYLMLMFSLDECINWDTGECFFDTDSFKSVLEFCNLLPAENVEGEEILESAAKINDRKQLLTTFIITDFSEIQMFSSLCEDMEFVGFPTVDGSVGSRFEANARRNLAITSKCADKDGAWQFVRQVLLPRAPHFDDIEWGFPINKSDFDVRAAEEMSTKETKIRGDRPFKIDVTQKEYDQVMELYNAINKFVRGNNDVRDIVVEQAGAYFAGDKSLDETVDLIQGRVELYVNEQR